LLWKEKTEGWLTSGCLSLKFKNSMCKRLLFIKMNIKSDALSNMLFLCTLLFFTSALNAQNDKKYIRQGNKEFEKSNYQQSEVSYRKAIDQNTKSPDAVFNIGDALYKQNKFEDAGKQFVENINLNENSKKKSDGLYNLGNSLLQANKLPESIEAYKGSLKLRPDNKEAKYNLAYAQDLLVKQKEEQKQQQDKDQKKDDQKKDQKDQKDQKDKDQQKDQNKNQDQKQQQQQKQEQGISKEDAERLLNALANDEKNVQEKVKLAKASKEKVRTVKNW
jgi:Ca-activated chloride channel homolog